MQHVADAHTHAHPSNPPMRANWQADSVMSLRAPHPVAYVQFPAHICMKAPLGAQRRRWRWRCARPNRMRVDLSNTARSCSRCCRCSRQTLHTHTRIYTHKHMYTKKHTHSRVDGLCAFFPTYLKVYALKSTIQLIVPSVLYSACRVCSCTRSQ